MKVNDLIQKLKEIAETHPKVDLEVYISGGVEFPAEKCEFAKAGFSTLYGAKVVPGIPDRVVIS